MNSPQSFNYLQAYIFRKSFTIISVDTSPSSNLIYLAAGKRPLGSTNLSFIFVYDPGSDSILGKSSDIKTDLI